MSTFDWATWRLSLGDARAVLFQSRDKLKSLGEFEPGKSPVIFDPLATGNKSAGSTLNHEMSHVYLMQDTAFGIFFSDALSAREVERFRELVLLAYQAQWQSQEACATYVQLTSFALSRERFDEAIAALPLGREGHPPYREMFDAISAVVPIEVDASPSRLEVLRQFALGVSPLSMDNDCLERFLEPSKINLVGLQAYLETESPNLRLKRILEALKGNPELARLLQNIELTVPANIHPSRVAMGAILGMISDFNAVSGIELRKQKSLFEEAWKPVVAHYMPEEPLPDELARSLSIPAITAPPELSLTLDEVRSFFVTAEARKLGVWAVIFFKNEDESVHSI